MTQTKPPLPSTTTPDDVEQQFYEALRQGDLEKVMAAWSDEDEIVCVHPGGPRMVGVLAIRASFETIFSHGAVQVQPEKIHRIQNHSSAVHSLVERVQVMTEEGMQTAWILVTNVYTKTMQGWRLMAHHASPGTFNEAHELVESTTILH
jgi:ketosteroid isomerase-like protein